MLSNFLRARLNAFVAIAFWGLCTVSPGAAQTETVPWTVQEIFSIGDIDDAIEFGQVPQAGVAHGDGRWFIADTQAKRIYTLDEAGMVLDSLGGEGQGPGEFQSIQAVSFLEDQSLMVVDQMAARVTWMDSEEGVVLGTQTMSPLSGALERVASIGDRIYLLFRPLPIRFQRMRSQTNSPRVEVRSRGSAAEAFTTLEEVTYDQAEVGGPMPTPTLFEPHGHLATVDSFVVLAASDRTSLRLLDRDGMVVDSTAGEGLGRTVTASERRRILGALSGEDIDDPMIRFFGFDSEAGWVGVSSEERRELVAKYDVAERFPAIVRVASGPDRTVLVQRGYGALSDAELATPAKGLWDVYELSPLRRTGRLLVPVEVDVLFAKDGWLAGIETTELGIQIFRVFRIQR